MKNIIADAICNQRKHISRKIMKDFTKAFENGRIRYQYDAQADTDTFEIVPQELYSSTEFTEWEMNKIDEFNNTILPYYDIIGFQSSDAKVPLSGDLKIFERKGKKYHAPQG